MMIDFDAMFPPDRLAELNHTTRRGDMARLVWGSAVDATRAAVIEECAKVCEKHLVPFNWASENADRNHRGFDAACRRNADAIRSLK